MVVLKKTYQTNHLDTSGIELILELGKGTEFGRANGREIGRVTEKNGPFVVQELVEVLYTISLPISLQFGYAHNIALSSFGLKVGRCIQLANCNNEAHSKRSNTSRS